MRRKQYAVSGWDRLKIASFIVCHSLTVVREGRQEFGSLETQGGRSTRRKGEGRERAWGVMGGRRRGEGAENGQNVVQRKKTNESWRGEATKPGQNVLKIAYFYNTAPVYCQVWKCYFSKVINDLLKKYWDHFTNDSSGELTRLNDRFFLLPNIQASIAHITSSVLNRKQDIVV